MAIKWLREYGLDAQLVERGILKDVTSTVLRTDGGSALVGRFDVASKRMIHRLFAIAERDGTNYRLTLAKIDIQHDMEDGKDQAKRVYVDQLDINNDRQDEVITSTSHHESWTYTIWRWDHEQRLWREAYTGGGGGC